ncbi:MAG: hypothetical protein HY453_02185 [Parcubacteria group bacterium]|nr:hypothetical protein [Parcubacteria group bacterium]
MIMPINRQQKRVLLVLYGEAESQKLFDPKGNYAHILGNYQRWSKYLREIGIYLCHSSVKYFSHQTGEFSKHFFYEDEHTVIDEPIKPDLVFDKIEMKHRDSVWPYFHAIMGHGIHIYNPPAIRDLYFHKLETWRHWSRFMPKTHIAASKDQAFALLKAFFPEKTVVAKELFGSGGENVYIGEKKEIDFEALTYPIFLQKFMPSSGFTKFQNSVSDLRIQFIDHKFIDCYSRVAPQGSLYTNTRRGAKIMPVLRKEIPDSVWSMVKHMQKDMDHFRRCHYALDFFFSGERPYLLEGGGAPGLSISRNDDEKKVRKYLLTLSASMFEDDSIKKL